MLTSWLCMMVDTPGTRINTFKTRSKEPSFQKGQSAGGSYKEDKITNRIESS